MKQVVNAYRRKNLDKQRLAVLRLELNYELAVLYDALQEENEDKKTKAKRKLTRIREELIKLEAL
ncbi:hypothetical protein [Lederbergia galactosidilytica]|uniref:Uncharacterized protein n=1 Tax=Lederbergia galactosidilytica TaxID=217031 RepID=A0A0Q9Y4C3_9BACI|nr:hypothetical protein [Lederbergia galactosidilytica]KRG10913.1 hypothetical protein ACA29_20100 [Lederbergia galactosidilytica]KRG14123.1 hypothetical protein ACA30_12575 [Virgibacillus soli]MBP1913791.1 hypothetical protein [Lederbergia galactosidilytica]OAK72984.1 hypothetical protein ABB05_07060 [Lederbergia galactosidilytica]